MGFLSWKDEYRYLKDELGLLDLVSAARRLLIDLKIDEEKGLDAPSAGTGADPLVRLIRYYTDYGAMTKPVREGREARYSYVHLLQFLAIRLLSRQGWRLSRVATQVSTLDVPELEHLLPDKPLTEAEQAMLEIKGRFDARQQDVSRLSSPSLRFSRERVEQSVPMMQLEEYAFEGDAYRVSRNEWSDAAMIELAPWCTVVVDMPRYGKVSRMDREKLGRVLVEALHRLPVTRGRGK